MSGEVKVKKKMEKFKHTALKFIAELLNYILELHSRPRPQGSPGCRYLLVNTKDSCVFFVSILVVKNWNYHMPLPLVSV